MARTTARKTLLLMAKLALAAALLAYVISLVHWRDYARTLDGKETPILAASVRDGQTSYQVAEAGLTRWAGAGEFRPVSMQTADGRQAMIIQARPDWHSPAGYEVHVGGRRQWLDAADLLPQTAQVVQRGFRGTILSARPGLLALSFAAFILPVLILSVRWWYLLRIQEIHISLREAVRLTFLGTFFNYVVPGTVSGDLVKAYYVSRHTPRKAAALVAIFVDRAVGLLEFAILPAVVMVGMFATGAGGTERLAMPGIMVAVVLAAVAAAMAFLLSPALRRALRIQKLAARLPLQHHLAVAAEAANLYRRRLPALVKALAMTLGGQASFIVAIMLAGLSLSSPASPLPVAWYQYFLYVPLIYIIAAVPISPGGLGLAETFFVTFFTPLGATASQALAVALVARLFPMIVSTPGLLVALTGPKLPAAAQMKKEMEA